MAKTVTVCFSSPDCVCYSNGLMSVEQTHRQRVPAAAVFLVHVPVPGPIGPPIAGVAASADV